MSIDISISNRAQSNCHDVIRKLLKAGIDARVIETMSTIDNKVESGCLITVGKEYNDQKKISDLWAAISENYKCSHIKIPYLFDGCIFDYFARDNMFIKKVLKQDDTNCPHSK